MFLLLTDDPAVVADFGSADARPITDTTPAFLRTLTFPEGSMGPKVRAACRFVEFTFGTAAIGALCDIEHIIAGKAGTIVTLRGIHAPNQPG
jgi:carbamate kinase